MQYEKSDAKFNEAMFNCFNIKTLSGVDEFGTLRKLFDYLDKERCAEITLFKESHARNSKWRREEWEEMEDALRVSNSAKFDALRDLHKERNRRKSAEFCLGSFGKKDIRKAIILRAEHIERFKELK